MGMEIWTEVEEQVRGSVERTALPLGQANSYIPASPWKEQV